jgi:hypothetical protein
MRDEVSHLCHTAIRNVARPAGFEPATLGLEGPSSKRLSMTVIFPRGRSHTRRAIWRNTLDLWHLVLCR